MPPKGVDYTYANLVSTAAATPRHNLVSTNSTSMAGNVIYEQSPEDLNRKIFIYDKYNRLRISQDAQQQTANLYTYIKYDKIGRVIETGELFDANLRTPVTRLTQNKILDDAYPNTSVLRTEYSQFVYDDTYEQNINTSKYPQYKPKNCRSRLGYASRCNNRNGRVPQDYWGDWDIVTTAYSYDAMGHVEFVLQQIPLFNANSSQRPPPWTLFQGDTCVVDNMRYVAGVIRYDHDYVSGNINQMAINDYDRQQSYYQKYNYDADNRLIETYSSRNGSIWDRDSKYQFYPHGPLFRSEIGSDGLVVNDYYYTLEGWNKGMNTYNTYSGENSDGRKTCDRPFEYSVNYYERDFIHNIFAPNSEHNYQRETNFYNGNISSVDFNFSNIINNGLSGYASFAYNYDRIYRLKSSELYHYSGPNWDKENRFSSNYTYDLNGNILRRENLDANGNSSGDLNYINAAINSPNYYSNQVGESHNLMNEKNKVYEYDSIGNLKNEQDAVNNDVIIKHIEYTYDGKVRSVVKYYTSDTLGYNLIGKHVKIRYVYDANGYRVAQFMDDYDSPESVMELVMQPENMNHERNIVNTLGIKNKYWLRTEKGDVAAIYENKIMYGMDIPKNRKVPAIDIINDNYAPHKDGAPDLNNICYSLTLSEWDIYAGSKDGRLAIAKPDTLSEMDTLLYATRGHKTYEAKDYLGTPRVTYLDLKYPSYNDEPDTANYYYNLYPLSTSTTYPYGEEIPELSYENEKYAYGFTGHQKDEAIGKNLFSTQYREYNAEGGRWWSIDPQRAKFPSISPYVYANADPISNNDIDGGIVHDKNKNIIFTITDRNVTATLKLDQTVTSKGMEGYTVRSTITYSATSGFILDDKGNKIEAFRANDQKITKKLELLDKNGKFVSYLDKDNKFSKNETFTIDGDNSYNCVGNAFAEQKFSINAGDIGDGFLANEGYIGLFGTTPTQIGDVGAYGTDQYVHYELFKTNSQVSTKGGVMSDGGLVNPGSNTGFNKFPYTIYRKNQPNTTVELPKGASSKVENGVNTVDEHTFNQVQNSIKNSNE